MKRVFSVVVENFLSTSRSQLHNVPHRSYKNPDISVWRVELLKLQVAWQFVRKSFNRIYAERLCCVLPLFISVHFFCAFFTYIGLIQRWCCREYSQQRDCVGLTWDKLQWLQWRIMSLSAVRLIGAVTTASSVQPCAYFFPFFVSFSLWSWNPCVFPDNPSHPIPWNTGNT